MAKSAQRIEARRLRRRGKSIILIAKKIGVSKSSVSRWCGDIRLSNKQVKKLLERSRNFKLGQHIAAMKNREERIQRMERLMRIGIEKVDLLTKRELFLIGSALYWAEGSKKDRRTVFVNSDSTMILIYLKWLRKCLKIDEDRIYCHVSINQDHKKRIDEVEEYWSNITGISRELFTNVSYKKVKNKKFYKNFNNHYGTLFVKVRRGTNLNYEILGYIEGLRRNV